MIVAGKVKIKITNI